MPNFARQMIIGSLVIAISVGLVVLDISFVGFMRIRRAMRRLSRNSAGEDELGNWSSRCLLCVGPLLEHICVIISKMATRSKHRPWGDNEHLNLDPFSHCMSCGESLIKTRISCSGLTKGKQSYIRLL